MRNPAFTLEQWRDIFESIETLPEYEAFEEMFRSDCVIAGWDVLEWSTVTRIARQKMRELYLKFSI
ncbi:MAG: hypothetical protein U0T75_01675 [Chitinophagales bacterium]